MFSRRLTHAAIRMLECIARKNLPRMVDRDKCLELVAVAREYLRHLASSCPWRLEGVSVYYDQELDHPQMELSRTFLPWRKISDCGSRCGKDCVARA
jgi:hypothetical protein